jgi:glycosyltransferase involved in cell wall biosynthesis
MLRVRRDVSRFLPDIVQVNKTTYAGILPRFLPRACRVIYDVRQLGLWGDESLRGRFANWRVVRRVRKNSSGPFDLACFPSRHAAERVLGVGWRHRAAITPIAVHERFLRFQHPTGGNRPAGPVRFIYVGSVVPGRRLEILIQAAGLLLKSDANFEMVIMGPGDGAARYRQEASGLGLQDHVRIFPGVPYSEIPAALSQYDVALAYVTSIEDWRYQVTLKVLEYRALGLPIIASDLPPNRDVVEEEVNGLLAQNTPSSFAATMHRFLEPSFLASVRSRSLSMRQGRTWEDVADVHEKDVYERVMKGPR